MNTNKYVNVKSKKKCKYMGKAKMNRDTIIVSFGVSNICRANDNER